ncbi:NAD+ diphosphatase [Austwickia chelonae]|uniref:NAD(+) diphosphatase n=2 Tax=Austwickia TaxID=1184606 RepID=K6V8L8_9MICO|nr:putative hydrolase [Austwickia chelonae NBRC 105200]SEW40674.1 NAD+ diphosphatase [Austwickia chelonae]
MQYAHWSRRGEERLDAGLIDRVLDDPGTLICDLSGQSVGMTRSGDGVLWRRPGPEDRAAVDEMIWLGGDPGRLARCRAEAAPGAWHPWREAMTALGEVDAEAVSIALALGRWHRSNPFCPACGRATARTAAGWMRSCPGCGAEYYPRTDPVVIMAVLDAEDRICLVRGHRWSSPVGMSCPAGFVDAAESLEDAVIREVDEELGLKVVSVAYAGSQPWPAVSQLMVAMVARVESPELSIDPAEVVAAQWFDREELAGALRAGEVTLPVSFAAGRWLVEGWLGERVPDEFSTVYGRVE